jgi:hypothetical protein
VTLASPDSGIRTGMNGISALRRSAAAMSRTAPANAWSKAGAFRIDLRRDKGAADAPFGMRGREFRRIEAGPGDDRGVARGDARRRAVDSRKRLHLATVNLVERTVEDGKAKRLDDDPSVISYPKVISD